MYSQKTPQYRTYQENFGSLNWFSLHCLRGSTLKGGHALLIVWSHTSFLIFSIYSSLVISFSSENGWPLNSILLNIPGLGNRTLYSSYDCLRQPKPVKNALWVRVFWTESATFIGHFGAACIWILGCLKHNIQHSFPVSIAWSTIGVITGTMPCRRFHFDLITPVCKISCLC